jgi:hypothetical protein
VPLRILHATVMHTMRRAWRVFSARSFSTSPSAPAPAVPTPAAPAVENAGEKSDFAFIAKASAGVLAFGVPWWFLTQVRDDAEFRGYLEDTQPSLLAALREHCPSYVPFERARCYRLCELPEGGAQPGQQPSSPGAAGGARLAGRVGGPHLGQRTALGSLESLQLMQAEVVPSALAQLERARQHSAAAQALTDRGEATQLYVASAQAQERSALAALQHAQATARAWASGDTRYQWRPAPQPAGSSRSWWDWARGSAAGQAVGESSLAWGGGDEGRPQLWRGAATWRAFLPLAEAHTMELRLEGLKSGSRLLAEVEQAERARPPAPPPEPTPEPPAFYEEIGTALRTFFLGQQPAAPDSDQPPGLVQEAELQAQQGGQEGKTGGGGVSTGEK